MATVVRSFGRALSGYNKEESERKGESEERVVIPYFLGGGPIGFGSRVSNLRPDEMNRRPQKPSPTPARRQIPDLNLPPITEVDDDDDGDAPPPQGSFALDLNHVTPVPSKQPWYCTVEFVKLALERAERESRLKPRRGRMDGSPSSSLSSAATNSSIKRRGGEEGALRGADGSDWILGSLMAARCPHCLFYVMVPWLDPLCPNCGWHVPVPAVYKKPRVRF